MSEHPGVIERLEAEKKANETKRDERTDQER
jgi:hypothetical protein